MERQFIGKYFGIIVSCLLLNATPGWAASSQLKLSFQSPVMKVFQDEPSPGTRATEKVSMHQSFQLLVAVGDKHLHNVSLSIVAYVLTHSGERGPWGKDIKIGWWPARPGPLNNHLVDPTMVNSKLDANFAGRHEVLLAGLPPHVSATSS